MNELALADTSRGPARPERLTVDFYEEPGTLLVHKKRRGGPWFFLLLWLIGWSGGCVMALAHGVFPLLVPWFFVAGLLVWMMFGKETLVLDRDQAIFRRIAFFRRSSRIVPRREIQGFRECHSSHKENDEYLWGIEMVTLGQPVRFAFRLPDRERAWLIHQLNRFLGTSHDQGQLVQPSPARAQDASADKTSGSMLPATEELTLESTRAEPPTDCRWQFSEDADALTFRHKGRWHLGVVAILLFLNAFWNGIVSVFVLALFDNRPQGWDWWGLFMFLIPFVVIGAAMFVALIMAVLEPFRRTLWHFEWDRIVRQTRWPVYCQTRLWEMPVLDRLEMRRRRDNDSSHRYFWEIGQMPFQLALVARNNVDLCTLSDLTEGEARWMAHIIVDRLRNWFPK